MHASGLDVSFAFPCDLNGQINNWSGKILKQDAMVSRRVDTHVAYISQHFKSKKLFKVVLRQERILVLDFKDSFDERF